MGDYGPGRQEKYYINIKWKTFGFVGFIISQDLKFGVKHRRQELLLQFDTEITQSDLWRSITICFGSTMKYDRKTQ